MGLTIPILGKTLKQLRKKKKISREEMAENLNLSIETYRKYEDGRTLPPTDRLIDIANFLDCTPDYLFGYINTSNHNIDYIYQETGLSEEAISRLHNWKESSDLEKGIIKHGINCAQILSTFLESEEGEQFMYELESALANTAFYTSEEAYQLTRVNNPSISRNAYIEEQKNMIDARIYKISILFGQILRHRFLQEDHTEDIRRKGEIKWQASVN